MTIIVLAVTCILLAAILVTDFWLHRRKRHRIVNGMEGRSGARPLISDAEEDGDDLDNHEIWLEMVLRNRDWEDIWGPKEFLEIDFFKILDL